MKLDRFGDVMVGAVGNAAGTVVDPGTGLGRLRAALSGRAVVSLAAGMLLGYLVARYWR
ncbi:hypothetical protein [Micromonospora craterilacus]|uniref:hypothetical protein n=1 Tax=Micromonospora craterilacus TaxID=1655439 RepID=UPI0013146321|nr:hypothetical protein [Micromonospora craterilacus]